MSSTDLMLPLNSGRGRSSVSPMDRAKSASSGALFAAAATGGSSRRASSTKLPDFSHVESKVKQYIHSVKSLGGEGKAAAATARAMQKSKYCGNLSPSPGLGRGVERRNSLTESPRLTADEQQRPKTAPSQQEGEPLQTSCEANDVSVADRYNHDDGDFCDDDLRQRNKSETQMTPCRSLSQAHSKSVPNLCSAARHLRHSKGAAGGGLSKSAVSVAALGSHLGDLIDSEDSDYEAKVLRYFSRDNLNEIVIESEDLLHLGNDFSYFQTSQISVLSLFYN